MGKGNYMQSKDSITGLKTGQSTIYTMHGLEAQKKYEVTVVAINEFNGRSESLSATVTVTTEGKMSWYCFFSVFYTWLAFFIILFEVVHEGRIY